MGKQRYVVLLKDQKNTTLKQVENEFKFSITSSEDLSKDLRSFQVIGQDNAVLYKNLGAIVVEDLDEQQLEHALLDASSSIVHYEKEREFFTAGELELLQALKTKTGELQQAITQLEEYLSKKPLPQTQLVEMEWGLKAIGLERTAFTGSGVDVCVLDTGLDVSHPDFSGREIEGKSFVEGEAWDNDQNGHGTHCAGIAVGNIRSDTGRQYGVAKGANLKIAKVLSNKGVGTTSSIIDAIDWAITKKFRVISLSLASRVQLNESPSVLFETIGEKALENNCLLIAAAGNHSNRPALPAPVSSPANARSIMAVAAIDGRMNIAKFSNAGLNPTSGGNINVCAPGVDIISSVPVAGNVMYRAKSGTSMATPFVSGVAALYMEQFPAKTAKEIWETLEGNAKAISGLKYRDIGYGLIQI